MNNFIGGSGSIHLALDEVHSLLVSSKEKELQELLKQFGVEFISKFFSTNYFIDEIIKRSSTYLKTISVLISQCCRSFPPNSLTPVYNAVNFALDPETPEIIVSIVEYYCKTLVMMEVKVFPTPPPVKEILNSFVARFQLEGAPNVSAMLRVLAVLLVFDQTKILFVAEDGFQLMSSFLATAEDEQLVKDLLGVYHSAIFNLSDDNKQSVYDVVAPQFAAVNPQTLIQTVMEKKLNVDFDVLMFIHGCLIPNTLGLINTENFNFILSKFQFENNETQLLITVELLIKFIALSKEKSTLMSCLNAQFVKQVEIILLSRNEAEILRLLISFIQMVVANQLENQMNSDVKLDLSMLKVPLIKYLTKLQIQMLKTELKTSIQQLEDVSSILVMLSLDVQQDLINLPEATGFLKLIFVLSEIPRLLQSTPAMTSLFSLLVKSGQLFLNLAENMGSVIIRVVLELIDQRDGQIVGLSILTGLSKNPLLLKSIDEDKFCLALSMFKGAGEEYDDILTDLVEKFGQNSKVDKVVEEILNSIK
ncbi:Conserved_hypothetical protein [Hexamita inflata]|uniref:Uncharacterized protein n=1 Tax=Hexamita inflata TaxID=28002 RepID=A0ABP1GI98_9EUKA